MRLIRIILFAAVCLFLINKANSQEKSRPRIGIALSGGGAKGLAHIGILKAIDSAGLKIDYVTGTSMGSIIGGLYACGYSGDTIEALTRSMNWDILLSNRTELRTLRMDEKSELDKYAIELPWDGNGGFKIGSGFLESEEIWLKLSELFFPVYETKDFTKLPRPFQCVATDISTGEAYTFNKGEIVTAIRASMAIPSVFTAVEVDDRKLVDGGLVRNFPVSDAKALGADYVIGSSTATGLLPTDKIKNPVQVMMQVIFFKEKTEAANEKELCNLYIHHDMDKYSMASFNSVDSIIEKGIQKGREMYPYFKQLADSLDTIYGKDPTPTVQLPKVDSVKIVGSEFNGLENSTPSFFAHRLSWENNRWYTAREIDRHIRIAFGTRYYQKITYNLKPLNNREAIIVFNVEENPLTFSKLGAHYNSFSGISLIGNVTSRNILLPYSRSMVTANLGEDMRIKGEHLQYFSTIQPLSASALVQAENVGITTYRDYAKDGLYKQFAFLADVNCRVDINRQISAGLGTRFELLHFKPDIPSSIELKGSNSYFTSYLFLKYNSLSNNVYPKSGLFIDATFGRVFDQHPSSLRVYNDKQLITNFDSLGISFDNFFRATFNLMQYSPINKKYTFTQQFQAGINFNKNTDVSNSFSIGGLNNELRNQILFAGLNENTVNAGSVAAWQIGLRYQMYNNLFLTGKANVAYCNFLYKKFSEERTFLSGYSLTLAYNFLLGPLELSAMYCDQSKKILPYINIGVAF